MRASSRVVQVRKTGIAPFHEMGHIALNEGIGRLMDSGGRVFVMGGIWLAGFEQGPISLDFSDKFCFAGQVGLVFGGKQLWAVLHHRVPDDRFALIRAKDDPYGGFVSLRFFEVIKHPPVHIHLPDVLVGELAGLEVNQDKAFQEVVVKDEVDIKVLGLGADTVLPPDEGKAAA
jgi:hypothetical protein